MFGYVDRALTLAQKRYADVKNRDPQSPLLQMYDSIVQQLLFLRDLIEGKEKDRAKLWDMTFGMYAGRSLIILMSCFLKGCQMPGLLWIKSAEG
ncbi:immunity protein Tsi6 family protein [Enterobacter hormaechei]